MHQSPVLRFYCVIKFQFLFIVAFRVTEIRNFVLLIIHCVIYFVCLFLLTFAYFNLNHLLLFFRVKEEENRNETVAKMPFLLRLGEA